MFFRLHDTQNFTRSLTISIDDLKTSAPSSMRSLKSSTIGLKTSFPSQSRSSCLRHNFTMACVSASLSSAVSSVRLEADIHMIVLSRPVLRRPTCGASDSRLGSHHLPKCFAAFYMWLLLYSYKKSRRGCCHGSVLVRNLWTQECSRDTIMRSVA